MKTTTSVSFSIGNLLVLDNPVFRNASYYWVYGSRGGWERCSREIMVKICLKVLVFLGLKLLQNQTHGKRWFSFFSVFLKVKGFFFLSKRKLFNYSDAPLKVVRRAGVM